MSSATKYWMFGVCGIASFGVAAGTPESDANLHRPALVNGVAGQQQSAVFPERRIQAHDPQGHHWLLNDPSLPGNVTDAQKSFNAGEAIWLTLPEQATLLPAVNENRGVLFYHGDHLGSSSVMTDRTGAVVKEIVYFPFGEVRHSHEPGVPVQQPYGFTGKEQDAESDLHYFEARYLAGRLSRFISLDPKFANPGALDEDDLSSYLAEPQRANPYSYVRNNPPNHFDPTGLEDEAAVAALSFIAGAALAADRTGVNVLPPGARDTLTLTTPEIYDLVYPLAKPAMVREASFAGPVLLVARLLAKPFAKTVIKEAVKTEAKVGVNAFASTGRLASQGAETLGSKGGSLVTRSAPKGSELGYRSSAAEVARADKVLDFVRSSNNARLGMDMKEAAAHFNAAVAQALKQFP